MWRAFAALVSVVVVALAGASAACGGKPEPKAPTGDDSEGAAEARHDPEEGPALGSGDDPLLVAATRMCRLIDHKDTGVIAVAFAPEFFDENPPAKLDAALSEIRTGLGRCTGRMVVTQRASPIEGKVGIACEHGVLMLSIGLAPTEQKPMMALGYELRPGDKL